MAGNIDIAETIRKNNVKYFSQLVENYDINEITETSETLILIALKYNRRTIIDILINMNADLTIEDALGESALTYMAKYNLINIFKMLKSKNKLNNYINCIDSKGNNALLIASQNNNDELVLYLLKNEANPDIQNNNGNTAIMEAAINNNMKIIKHLLDYNANLNIINIHNYSILNICIDDRNHNLINYILKQDIDLWDEETDYLGHSYHVNNKSLFELLLSRGVSNNDLLIDLVDNKDKEYLNIMLDYIIEIDSEIIYFLIKRIKKNIKSEKNKDEVEYYTNIFEKLMYKDSDIKILKRKR